jgi:predicted nucleotidyltransferase
MTKNKSNLQYEKILREAKGDPNIIGFVLTGSRGKGFEHEKSDYDPWIIVINAKIAKEYEKKYDEMNLKDIDLCVASLAEFKKLSSWNEHNIYERYDYTHVQILIDKTGEITKIIKEKGGVPKDKKDNFINSSLDGYINQVFRSVKSIIKNDQFAAHLEAVFSIPLLLDAIFALEGRPKPFYCYLEKELEKYPLKIFPWKKDEFIRKLSKILTTGDLKTQQGILIEVEKMFRKAGYNQVFDDWEGKDRWAMTYRPQ